MNKFKNYPVGTIIKFNDDEQTVFYKIVERWGHKFLISQLYIVYGEIYYHWHDVNYQFDELNTDCVLSSEDELNQVKAKLL